MANTQVTPKEWVQPPMPCKIAKVDRLELWQISNPKEGGGRRRKKTSKIV